jgi:O-antigen/teichoic acid export membrane protein
MGIIQRQATKQTFVNYTGTAIAAVSTIFIYPLEKELYGLWLTLFGMASFFIPFASLGIRGISIRFFPQFRDPGLGHQGFLPFVMGAAIFCYLLFLIVLKLLWAPALSGLASLGFNTDLLQIYFIPILILILLLMLNTLLTAYISNFQRIVVPGIIEQFWPKIAVPGLVLLGWAGFISPSQYVWGILIMETISLAALLFYLARLGELRLRPSSLIFRSGKLREMATYALYGTLGNLGTIFAFRIDHIMISLLASVSSTGIYGIAQFIGNSLEMPTRSIYAIAAPIIAKAWKENDVEEIRNLYHKSSLNLLLLGLPLFGMILLSLDDLFRLTADYESLKAAVWVVYLIGAGKLIDMACSVNGQIIGYSRYFRFNLIAVLLLAGINVVLNYRFIPQMGIVGAAWASFIAISAFNILRSLFVFIVWRMQPFSWRTGATMLIAAGATALAWLIPDTGLPVVDILQNSLIVAGVYVPLVLGLRLSREVNDLVAKWTRRLFKTRDQS